MLEVLLQLAEMESSSESKVIDSIESAFKDPSIYMSSRGVKLKLSKVSRLLVADVGRKVEIPKPPRVFVDDKGREEENPSDPTYQEALQEANYTRGMTTVAVYLTLGTKLMDLPKDVDGPDGTEWAETLTELGIEIPEKGRGRYLSWLKYYALDDTELNEVITAITRLSGVVMETDVKETQDSFQGA